MTDLQTLAFIAAVVIAIVELAASGWLVWAFTTSRRVTRRELDTRAELHERDRGVLTGERDGWRNVAFDLKSKLEKSAAINVESVKAIKTAAEVNAEAVKAQVLALATIEKMHQNDITSRTGTATTQSGNGQ